MVRQNEILNAVLKMLEYEAKEAFFGRQAMAALTRALGINRRTVERFWTEEIARGPGDSGSVAVNLKTFSEKPFPARSNRAHKYLFPDSVQFPYPLPKFLILCSIAASDANRGIAKRREEVDTHLRCPWYRHWINQINPNWLATS